MHSRIINQIFANDLFVSRSFLPFLTLIYYWVWINYHVRKEKRIIKSKKSTPDKKKLLETFDNSYPKRGYLIIHRTQEFTSICPKTGQPDFGMITISYIAKSKCIELKSLKYYLQSFRSEGIFYENVVNRILDDLVSILKPKWFEVRGDFSVRGGINSTVTATFGEK